MKSPLPLAFARSAERVDQLPDSTAEVAVIGRSNVGKSSLLNALAKRRGLAKTSAKPGRTQLLNAFTTPVGTTLVDLPGYGYASTASARTRGSWRQRMERYLVDREQLVVTLWLVDGEIGPTGLDREVLAWLRERRVSFITVATKADKVKPSARGRRRAELAAACELDPSDIVWVSAQTGDGIDDLRGLVAEVLGVS